MSLLIYFLPEHFVNGKVSFLALLPTSHLIFSASINISQNYNFPQFSVRVSLLSHFLTWPGVSAVISSCYETLLFSISFYISPYSSATTCPSVSVSICPTPEFLFLCFLIKSVFNIIPMSKCSLFQLQIEFPCLFWNSFTQPQGLETRTLLNHRVMCHRVFLKA